MDGGCKGDGWGMDGEWMGGWMGDIDERIGEIEG